MNSGCVQCYPERHQKLAAGRTAEDLYAHTMLRLWQLEHQYGCELHLVWGCEFKEQLRRDAQLRELWRQVFVPRPLDPREDALRGGRTEPFQLQHVCTPEEEIVAIDIVGDHETHNDHCCSIFRSADTRM